MSGLCLCVCVFLSFIVVAVFFYLVQTFVNKLILKFRPIAEHAQLTNRANSDDFQKHKHIMQFEGKREIKMK